MLRAMNFVRAVCFSFILFVSGFSQEFFVCVVMF